MAARVPIRFGTYYRPREKLSLEKRDLLPPAPGITGYWSCFTYPDEFEETSKTGCVDVSILWDSKPLLWLSQ
eukprot:5909323-Lingulodinium_polyedra.AAC.1